MSCGMSKTEFSRLLGCRSVETYINWIARGALPGAYVEQAKRILGDIPTLTAAKLDLLNKVDQLSEEDRKTILRLVDSLLTLD